MEKQSTRQRVRVPADIYTWPVSYTSRKVYIALQVFQLRAQGGRILKTYDQISRLCGLNVKTVAACVRELADAGYIQVKNRMYWSEDGKQLFRGTNEYTIVPMATMDAGYIWLPVRLLAAPVSPAAFSVLLFLLRKQGANTRSWPSLRRGFQTVCQASGTAMPRKTVCAALAQLRRCLMVIVLACRKRNQALSMNSYMLTFEGSHTAPAAASPNPAPSADSPPKGGYLFGYLYLKTKITNRLMYRKRKRCFLIYALCTRFRSIAQSLKNALFDRPPIKDTG